MRAFLALKFAPSRCPKCGQRFDTPGNFARWAGGPAGSFVEAQARQHQLYPELYRPVDEPGVCAWANPHQADFIGCARCGNKTLRIALGERTVGTRAEAEQLVAEAQYTCVVECEIPPGSSLEDWLPAELADRRPAEARARDRDRS